LAVQNRIEEELHQNRQEYGAREKFKKIRKFLGEGKDRKLEKFYL